MMDDRLSPQKTLSKVGFVTRHDFSRAEKCHKESSGFSSCFTLSPRTLLWILLRTIQTTTSQIPEHSISNTITLLTDLICRWSQGSPSILKAVLAPLRFLWNATRGHRLAPWRSEYLRWRIETYSGMPAGTLTAGKIFLFVWTSKWELLSFLLWTGRLERDVRKPT
jgi:hypothetical protein